MTLQCPYCGSPHVLEQKTGKSLVPPSGVLPFQTDEMTVRVQLKNWFQEKRLPKSTKVAKARGVYMPAWLFDLRGSLHWKGQVRVSNDWVDLTGEEYLMKDDRPVYASRRIPMSLQYSIHSFDLTATLPYDERFLANWPAETYQVPLSDASLLAREQLLNSEKMRILAEIGKTTQDFVLDSSGLVIDSYNLVFLPVWFSYYLVEDKKHSLLINGQTGHVFSEDKPRIGLDWLDALF
jgi:hypothetical protein